MAKPKKEASKTPKKRSTKYSKLAAVCSKELAAKKKALVLAEKRLAKAQKTHVDLLSDVARLDMLERSLKAVNEGTEPPQNIKYVYNYPQWVWYGNPNGWYWNGYGYTTCVGNGNIQGGQYTNSINTITTTSGSNLTVPTTNGNVFNLNANDSSGLIGYNSSGVVNSGALSTSYSLPSSVPQSSPSWQTVPTSAPMGQADFTVDLSTGATQEEESPHEIEDALEVGHGG